MPVNPLPCPLAIAAHHFGDVYAVDSPRERLTYADLHQRVGALVHVLRHRGINFGDRVGLFVTPEPETIIAFWALLRVGVTVCLVNPSWPADAVDQALQVIGVGQVVTDREWSEWLAQCSGHSSITQMKASTIGASPATIIFSSGSSGVPKAIAHDFEAHLASARGSNTNLPLTSGDAWFLSLPLFHVSGLAILLRVHARRGNCHTAFARSVA